MGARAHSRRHEGRAIRKARREARELLSSASALADMGRFFGQLGEAMVHAFEAMVPAISAFVSAINLAFIHYQPPTTLRRRADGSYGPMRELETLEEAESRRVSA